jgi:chemotaxis protein CheD
MQHLRSGLPETNVQPGGRFATVSPRSIKTLLGSCVAACLYDEEAKVAGLNHFLLAAPRYAKALAFTETDAGRYGINAMELLINDMVKLGAKRSRLKAKVFGGASVLGIVRSDAKFLCVSEVNQRFIRDYLTTERIPIVSEDLGGSRGRVIHFLSDSYKVFRRYIQKTETESVEEEEHSFWAKAIAKPAAEESAAILF